MAQLTANIKLRGRPSAQACQDLHTLMKGQHWVRVFPGSSALNLPRAIYQMTSPGSASDSVSIAGKLAAEIETQVWKPAKVVVVSAE